jgi:GTPase
MKFIDEAVLIVKAGHGGAGAKHFRREKFIPFGGPDGGDGGRGGSVILRADPSKSTLLDFQFRPKWEADDGKPGGGNNREGKSADNLIIPVPVGTQVYRQSDNELVRDLDQAGSELILAKGGRGGKGNSFFKSATNQVPEHHQPGEAGEEGEYRLSLKLVADVGLVGLPNAGKSTLISRISAARPKIADYPFTTLVPNLGVVQGMGGKSFVVADIPGLIPGAHEGKGLGIQFLKHVERTRVLCHLIDISDFSVDAESGTPWQRFKEITEELRSFSPELAERPLVVIFTKVDALSDRSKLKRWTTPFTKAKLDVLTLSSATGEGLEELIQRLQALL